MTMVIVGLVFAAVVLLVAGLGMLLLKRNQPARRLKTPEAGQTVSLRDRLVADGKDSESALRRRLLAAGYGSASAPATFRAVRIGVAITSGIVSLLFLSIGAGPSDPTQRLLMAACSAGMGWMWPSFYLDKIVARRRAAMRVGFPDSLDLMQVCVESGLGLDAAIALVGEEIGKVHPQLGAQYKLLGRELRAGRSRDEALRALADRIGLDEAKAFATVMIQSDALGSSVADALRTYAEDMRGRRLLAAEEKAQQLGVKLSLPLVGLMLPALMLVILVPAAQKIARLMLPMMSSF